jgi:hypothetical protein
VVPTVIIFNAAISVYAKFRQGQLLALGVCDYGAAIIGRGARLQWWLAVGRFTVWQRRGAQTWCRPSSFTMLP